MDTIELLKQLLNKSKEEIEFCLLILMLKDKLDFVSLNKSYVEYLNEIKEDRLNQLIEVESCILESFHHNKTAKENNSIQKGNKKHTQRCLYFLNKSNRFQMQSLNNKYEYNEEKAKEYSWYERNKNMKK